VPFYLPFFDFGDVCRFFIPLFFVHLAARWCLSCEMTCFLLQSSGPKKTVSAFPPFLLTISSYCSCLAGHVIPALLLLPLATTQLGTLKLPRSGSGFPPCWPLNKHLLKDGFGFAFPPRLSALRQCFFSQIFSHYFFPPAPWFFVFFPSLFRGTLSFCFCSSPFFFFFSFLPDPFSRPPRFPG